MLVDNGSTDGTAEAVREAMPEVEILALPRNVGFAAGMNAGIRRALDSGATWTLLMNNDATVEPDMISRLLSAADGHPRRGVLVPTVRVHDHPEIVWPSAGRRRRLTLAAFDTSASPPTQTPYAVDWAAACVVLVRRELWKDVGLFDERDRVYYEDHDLSLRARRRGWEIVHVPAAQARHRVAGSTGEGSPRQMYLLARSSVPYYFDNTRGAHRLLIVAYRVGSFAKQAARAVVSGRAAASLAYARGLRDGVRDLRRPPDRRQRRETGTRVVV
jgi:hypothetical protein